MTDKTPIFSHGCSACTFMGSTPRGHDVYFHSGHDGVKHIVLRTVLRTGEQQHKQTVLSPSRVMNAPQPGSISYDALNVWLAHMGVEKFE